ncbi:hypothetical protein AeRB84_006694 [Aphanomyces euteiches]|nr:hypothetical protein AeRB84_006694 [Aphanomyces euteiches]
MSICQDLKSNYGVDVAVRTMRHVLVRMGFKHQKCRTRFYLAETDTNVAFRAKYLRKKITNRCDNGCPVQPEVYFYESYCNLNHSPHKTWVDETKLRKTKSGKGPRVCIVGAGILSATPNGRMAAHFVEDSLSIWPSNSQLKEKTMMDTNCDEDDYHGNFNAALFEKWFSKLCRSLQEKHGPCVIHMNGAKYHKHNTQQWPTSASTKLEIQLWLSNAGILFDAGVTKAELLETVKSSRGPPTYAAQVIASEHGHTLLFTPPYHLELQPIELIWGAVKDKIACRPSKNISELMSRLKNSFGKVTSHQWIASYRKVQEFEDTYTNDDDGCILAEEDIESDDGGDLQLDGLVEIDDCES